MHYLNSQFLADHSLSILDFYTNRVVDGSGGYFQNFYDDGSQFEPGFRHLVSSTRIIVNYATAAKVLNRPEYLKIAKHGLEYLQEVHWQADSQFFAWTLRDHEPLDMTQQAYGYAFVLLAFASAHKAGLLDSKDKLQQTYDLLEQRFFQPDYGLYADEISAEGALSEYRGQNANMHICEAMIAAYEATDDTKYLHRARLLAENIAFEQASLTGGLIWEHFTSDFCIDWDYNRADPKNLYRPWGFQPGHHMEWAKLLLQLHRLQPEQRLVDKARLLFEWAIKAAWDAQHGGLVYGVDPQGNWCDEDKYFWVQAESFAAAALLYQATGEQFYLDCYQKCWQYSDAHLVDHKHGAWFRILRRDNRKYSNHKSSAGAKCDYHNLMSCFEVLRSLEIEKQKGS